MSPSDASLHINKSIILIGLMGSGKSTVGMRLAKKLGLPFADSDTEIETSLGYSISYIFEYQGEAFFRDIEKRTIASLLTLPPHVIATGGGAFMNAETRKLIKEKAISVWLKADLDTLVERVSKRNNRPLLAKGDKRAILEKLMQERYPIYAEADFTIESGDGSHHVVVQAIIDALSLKT